MSRTRPFLFTDVFRPRRDLRIEPASIDGIPAVIVDDFLESPERAREVVGGSPAPNWKMVPDGRNFRDYFDCRLRFPVQFPCPLVEVAQQIVSKVYGTDVIPKDPCVDVNWFMQVNRRRADFAVPHHDVVGDSPRNFTCLTYLNRKSECSGGTSFFRFRESGSLVADRAYHERTVSDDRIVETGRDYWADGHERYWDLAGGVEMAPGRLVVFPSEFFHAAWHPEDSFDEFPRVTLAFWLVQ